MAIPPDAVDDAEADLDDYVYDPTGKHVASSTLGGTDEEVTIQDPADGTWTVYAHGWQAPVATRTTRSTAGRSPTLPAET